RPQPRMPMPTRGLWHDCALPSRGRPRARPPPRQSRRRDLRCAGSRVRMPWSVPLLLRLLSLYHRCYLVEHGLWIAPEREVAVTRQRALVANRSIVRNLDRRDEAPQDGNTPGLPPCLRLHRVYREAVPKRRERRVARPAFPVRSIREEVRNRRRV